MFFSAKSLKPGAGLELQEHGPGKQGLLCQAMAAWVVRVSPSALQRNGDPESLIAQQGSPGKAMCSGRARPSLGGVGPGVLATPTALTQVCRDPSPWVLGTC